MCLVFSFTLFFFFKQKTAYEMRISDWSSDVCSSDLVVQQVDDEVDDDEEETDQHEVGGHHGDIDLRYRLDEQQAHAWPLEHLLGDEAAGDAGDELQHGDGDDRNQGVLQPVHEVDSHAA